MDEFLLHGINAALALDQLQHHGAHVVPAGLADGVDIIGVGIAEALGEGEEILVEHRLARGRQGGDVRPWKELFSVRIVLRPGPYLSKLYLRASLIIPSLASAPPLAKKAALMPERRHSRSARAT